MDFTLPADHCGKMKENQKMEKLLDFVGELRKLWNMKVTVILIPTGKDKLTLAKMQKNKKKLIQTIRIYRKDIGMEFGIEKCAMLIMRKVGRETMKKKKQLEKINQLCQKCKRILKNPYSNYKNLQKGHRNGIWD